MPMRRARLRSSSLRNNSRPCIWPPMQRSAAAASTPSGAPPEPTYMSIPVSGLEVAMTPLTSPSEISTMRAPASRTLAISSAWRGRSRMQTTRSATSDFFACARFFEIGRRRLVEIDEIVGQAAADRDLVHVDVGRVEKMPASAIAITASALAPPLAVIVVPSSGSSAMSIGGPLPGADLFADIEHRRLVALALADHDGAVDRQAVQRLAHRIDGGLIGGLLVAAAHQARGRERRRLGHPHRLQRQVAIHLRRLGHGLPPRRC